MNTGRVLVTGAGGFIGAHLVRDQLARGCEVIAVDINLDALSDMGAANALIRVELDIRDAERLRPLLQGVDAVYHLAAAHLDVLKDESHFHDVNVRATGALARLSADAGVSHFVHCSSVGVYGPLQTLPANEQTPTAPEIAYERTKLAGEQAVCDVAVQSGLPAVILRPAWVFGPGCPRTHKLVRSIARRRFVCVGDGSNLRHPLYIDDMLAAIALAATHTLPNCETIIVAGPEALSVRQLVDLIIDELGLRYRPPRVPLWFMNAVCRVVETLAGVARVEPPISSRSLKFFTESSAFETAKASRLLGFEPRIDTRQGLRLTIEHYRAHGGL